MSWMKRTKIPHVLKLSNDKKQDGPQLTLRIHCVLHRGHFTELLQFQDGLHRVPEGVHRVAARQLRRQLPMSICRCDVRGGAAMLVLRTPGGATQLLAINNK